MAQVEEFYWERREEATPKFGEARPRQDGRAKDHDFQPRRGNRNLCGYPGCTSRRRSHPSEQE